MSKQFKSKADFIKVISSIAKDGSVVMDLTGNQPQLPDEKLYPYVKEAVNMELEVAIKNMPTALRFDLIKDGYEYLLSDLKFDELDGPGDYWPGKMTSYLLRKFPEYEPKLDWAKLKNTWLVQVLLDQPQFIDKIDFTKIDPKAFADLLSKRPEYANRFDFSKLNTPETAQFWGKLLEKQPQFIENCDLTLLNEHQKDKLKRLYPGLNF